MRLPDEATRGAASGVSGGGRVVGNAYAPTYKYVTMLWEDGKPELLADALAAAGVDVSDWELDDSTAQGGTYISGDGTILAGVGKQSGVRRAFVAYLPIRGDLNCDDALDFNDIDPFVIAISDRQQYEDEYPECSFDRADINRDGAVDFADIDPFVEALIS